MQIKRAIFGKYGFDYRELEGSLEKIGREVPFIGRRLSIFDCKFREIDTSGGKKTPSFTKQGTLRLVETAQPVRKARLTQF